ncbi:uncharacterized protein E0L32_002987 [Thyridium curvatum]|uniref:NmrA-like domain-containing protein n=1 Tax=Thyridium curvatum TaxID=1093900 RepID=A0A507BEY5_9PEZI|nr:uncharacterized protein E0L32_002987 [Thyridium curvatum]TPX17886.1 hypothetical protein E0L32_002987 [Thyridium curvatum]
MKVAIVGATGETGRSIVNGLANSSTIFEITALVRPASKDKPAVQALKTKGVQVVPIDLQGPLNELVSVLDGVDIVISAIHYQSLADEIPLSNAAKAAGVGRYVPCFFATKEDILDHIQRLCLPYTVIDVGWWFQLTLPDVPSGRFSYALVAPSNTIVAGGDTPCALTDVRDVGVYVAKIITDPRTLNKKVFAFTETKTQNQVFELVQKMSGEKPIGSELSAANLKQKVAELMKSSAINQVRAQFEYWNSWGLRGDNTPEYAKYLGYLIADELYPGLKGQSLEAFIQDIIDGKGEKVYSS